MTEVESANEKKHSVTSVADLTTCTTPFLPDETDDRFFEVTFDSGTLKFRGKLRPNASDFGTEWRNYTKHWIEELEGEEAAEVLAIGRPLIAYCCYNNRREALPPLLNDDTPIDIRQWNNFLNNTKTSIKSKLIAEYGRVDAAYAFSIVWAVMISLGKLVNNQDQRPITSWEYTQPESDEDAVKRVLSWLFRR